MPEGIVTLLTSIDGNYGRVGIDPGSLARWLVSDHIGVHGRDASVENTAAAKANEL